MIMASLVCDPYAW